ncbi:hypothetical protein FVEN_g13177 [Fusarium venenatum]|nr:hypothetical protein FVEN_g13177 [Fusarium venenatum]
MFLAFALTVLFLEKFIQSTKKGQELTDHKCPKCMTNPDETSGAQEVVC